MTWKIFLNGDWEQWTDSTLPSSVTNNLLIGDSPIGPRHFNGTLNDVRIYNRALSSSEIEDNYIGYNKGNACVIG